MRVRPALLAVASALLLAACGGDGGGGDARALAPLPGLAPYLDRRLAQCEADDAESCARLILEDGADVYADRALAALRGDGGGASGDDEASRLAACEAGDVEVCAELYLEAPVGSELEQRAFDGMLGGIAPGGGSDGGGDAAADVAIDPDGEAFFGDVALESGFVPDPYILELTAGGAGDAASLAVGCAGAVGSRPDLRLEFDAGVLPLNVYAYAADEDLTLVVRDPAGRYLCDDDTEGLWPAVLIDRPASGAYEIWVGVFGGAGVYADATLAISELDPVFP
ncbi:MAG: hypothetical protein ACO4BW_01360 [Nitriliruptoraceae bacterium]